ncbi:sodium- and chloride-dependent GABA transporter 3-like [Strongylocentrotus purpuratus]|uniref:Uncharacterized protein n=1 Tax=Strongylocentrotus purpuratus TaxID=7668 RepID=A0A7M7N7H4_STRPU|nr:sodium- and chloride-dependent GABA transporter 3-like [Strongylocentrotus purpuratus]
MSFVCVEGFITTVVDLFPNTLLRGRRREIFCAVICLVFCILGIPMVTNGGMYIFQLFDYYAASGFVLLWVAILEYGVIGWVYGGRRFMSDITEMTGVSWIKPYMLFSWMFASPLFAAIISIFGLVAYEPLKYEDVYVYPWWGYMLGMIMIVSSLINVPLFIFYQLIFQSEGSLRERWTVLTTSRVPAYVPPGPAAEKDTDYIKLAKLESP